MGIKIQINEEVYKKNRWYEDQNSLQPPPCLAAGDTAMNKLAAQLQSSEILAPPFLRM